MQFYIFLIVTFSLFWCIHSYVLIHIVSWFGGCFKWRYLLWIALYGVLFIAFKGYKDYAHILELEILSRAWFIPIAWVLLAMPIMLLFDALILLVFVISRLNSRWTQKWNALNIKKIGIGLTALISVLFCVGLYNFHQPLAIDVVDIKSDKVSRDYYVIHYSDLQFGSSSEEHVKETAKTIIDLSKRYPIDAIFNTGDHVDTANYVAEQIAPLRFDALPTFFSLGNHEFYHGHHKIIRILHSFDYQILRSANQKLDDLNIIGIDDNPDSNQVNRVLESSSLVDKDKFNILLYHRPLGATDAANKGIDLMLSGHTHGGQFYPYVWAVQNIFPFSQGINKIGNMILYVTDGVGLWGPPLRLGSRNELALIHIHP